jgi:hypothetical protein
LLFAIAGYHLSVMGMQFTLRRNPTAILAISVYDVLQARFSVERQSN